MVDYKDDTIAFLDSLLEHAPVGFAFFDRAHRYVKINDFLAEINGIPARDHLGKSIEELLPANALTVVPIVERVFATRAPVLNVEVAGETPLQPGVVRHWLTSFYPVFGDTKQVRYVGATVLEITERKRTEELLRESEQRFRVLADSAPVMIWMADADAHWTYFNKPWLDFTGRTLEEEVENGWTQGIHPDDLEQCLTLYTRAYAAREPFQMDYRLRRFDGLYRWMAEHAVPLYTPDGTFTGYVGSSIDITERKQLEEQKDEFISMASHELRTPMTSLKGFTNLLQRRLQKQGDKQALNYLAKMDKQINKLTALIADLLDLSRIQTGKLSYREEVFALDEIVREVVENIQQTTSTHRLILECEARPKVFGDRDRIGQVFINLLTNAIKYSPHAERIDIRVMARAQQAVVAVQDFGIGIDEEHQPHIFERFYQVSGPDEKTYRGLGIGLYISKEIIERHGGRLWVESKKGEGATFSFSLPLLHEESDKAS